MFGITKQMLKKSSKFWEAIGLLLILVAWVLEWQSVRKWDEAYNVYWKFFTTFNQAIYTADDQVGRQFQFAISRSVQQIKLDPYDPYTAYRAAWGYAEVRKLWFEQCMLEVRGVEEFMKNISQISSRYGLRVPPTLSSIEDKRIKLLDKLKALIDPNDANSKVSPIPKAEVISINQAEHLRREVIELVSASINPLNELREMIEQKSRSSSKWHSFFFMLGSVLLVAAKLVDWWIEKRIRS